MLVGSRSRAPSQADASSVVHACRFSCRSPVGFVSQIRALQSLPVPVGSCLCLWSPRLLSLVQVVEHQASSKLLELTPVSTGGHRTDCICQEPTGNLLVVLFWFISVHAGSSVRVCSKHQCQQHKAPSIACNFYCSLTAACTHVQCQVQSFERFQFLKSHFQLTLLYCLIFQLVLYECSWLLSTSRPMLLLF